jgi:hypothetical protein
MTNLQENAEFNQLNPINKLFSYIKNKNGPILC